MDYSEAVSAAKGAVRAINATGGVNGHPLVLLTCNSALLPTTEQACDRQMIAAHPAALADAFHVAFWWSVGFSAVAVLLSLRLPGAQRAPSARPGDGAGTREHVSSGRNG